MANPDPAWYPNGISDAMYAIVWSMYGWGDAFLYITSRYTDGYPSAFTVLDPAPMNVSVVEGRRRYRSGQTNLNPANMVQISRNPTGAVRGTSAIASYAGYANGTARRYRTWPGDDGLRAERRSRSSRPTTRSTPSRRRRSRRRG